MIGLHRGANPATALTLALCLVAIPIAARETPEDAFKNTLDQAQQAMQQHRFSDAVGLYRRANKMHQNACDQCLWGLANAFEALGAYKNVEETCDQMLALIGSSSPIHAAAAWNLKGLAILKQSKAQKDMKRLPDAEAAFRSAFAADPNLHVVHYNLGYAMMVSGDDAGGIAELKAYLQAEPDGRSAADARRLIEIPRGARQNFAPEFAFATMDGSYLSLDDLRGKIVLLDFWGSWCRPCVDSVGSLKRIQKRYDKEPFAMVSISVHDTDDKWRKFVTDHQMTWPQYRDESQSVSGAYHVNAFPSYFVIDQDGIVLGWAIGESADRSVERMIDDGLKKLKETSGHESAH